MWERALPANAYVSPAGAGRAASPLLVNACSDSEIRPWHPWIFGFPNETLPPKPLLPAHLPQPTWL